MPVSQHKTFARAHPVHLTSLAIKYKIMMELTEKRSSPYTEELITALKSFIAQALGINVARCYFRH